MDINFQTLPKINALELKIITTVDYYDGPITGFISHNQSLYWFHWHHEIDSDIDFDSPRIFLLHPVPENQLKKAFDWINRHEETLNEFRLMSNPHVYPMKEKQRAALRPLTLIENEIDELMQLKPHWENMPVKAWFVEKGQTFTLTNEECINFH